MATIYKQRIKDFLDELADLSIKHGFHLWADDSNSAGIHVFQNASIANSGEYKWDGLVSNDGSANMIEWHSSSLIKMAVFEDRYDGGPFLDASPEHVDILEQYGYKIVPRNWKPK